MAISFITTVGANNSTSYVTVDEFNSYVESLPFVDDVPSKNNATLIKKLLNISTTIIDKEEFYGYVTNPEVQSLEWPRNGCLDKRGYQILSTTIPQALKDAICEMAIFLFQNELNNNVENNFDQAENVSVNGVVSLSFSKNMYAVKLPAIVKEKLTKIGLAWVDKQPQVMR